MNKSSDHLIGTIWYKSNGNEHCLVLGENDNPIWVNFNLDLLWSDGTTSTWHAEGLNQYAKKVSG